MDQRKLMDNASTITDMAKVRGACYGGLLPPGAIYGCFSQRNLWMLSTSLYWQYFGTTNDAPPLN